MNKYYWLFLLTSYFLLISYLNGFLAINLVNKIKTNPTLPDLGYDIFPKISSDYPNLLLIFCIGYFTFRFCRRSNIQTLNRLFFCLNIIFTMRLATFTVTTYPPSTLKCYGRNPGEPIQWNVVSVILSQKDNTCIDYMFSGHVCYFLLLLFFEYELSPYLLEKIGSTIFTIGCIATVTMGRIHYSSDVIVAIIISTSCYLNMIRIKKNYLLDFLEPEPFDADLDVLDVLEP